ncbi:MAG TPA: DUF6662 family protein [Luteolibacter sp.]
MKRLLALAAALTAFASSAFADEQYFGYLYPAEGMPKGAWEIYQWNTYRTGGIGMPEPAFNFATEFEYGLTEQLATSFYVDYAAFDGEGMNFQGLRNSWKYLFYTPAKNDFGLGVYFEPIWARTNTSDGGREDKLALENKVLLQKNFLDDKLVWATNLVGEFEWERDPGNPWERKLEIEASTGLAYRICDKATVGIEALYQSEYDHFSFNNQEKWMFGVGPTVHYRAGAWWGTLTWMPQLAGGPSVTGHRNLDEYGQHEIRLKLGVNF